MLSRTCRLVLPPLVVVAALCVYRLTVSSAKSPGPRPERTQPAAIEPRFDEPRAATDEQLKQVLARLRPPAGQANTNDWVHALRLWGPRARFADGRFVDGDDLLNYFLDDEVFRNYAGEDAPPLFVKSERGVAARSFDDDYAHRTTSSYHVDDLLATLAESGVPLDTPMKLRNGEATVGDLLYGALDSFHLARHEYEWSIISYARYVHPLPHWRNRFGEKLEMAALARTMISPPLSYGACNGAHRLEAMTVLCRADEESAALSPLLKRRMLGHMMNASSLLAQSQTPEGYWTRRWPRGPAAQQDTDAPLYDRILVTGHQLEWLALAPSEVHPPREHIVRASQWLVRAMLEVDDKELMSHYGPFSHAARALCLWRGKEPWEVWSAAAEQSAE